MKTKTIKCNFENAQREILDARLDIPADIGIDEIKHFVIFCHCFTCSKETITTFRLSRLLAENGYGVLRFDFTGLGDSEGDFSSTTFSSTQDDVRNAIYFLEDNYRAPTFLMGHSMGGTTVLSVAQDYDFIKGIVTVASPSDPEHVLHHFGHALTLLEQGINASFKVAGRYYDIRPGFVDDLRRANMKVVLSRLVKPVLIFSVENDSTVNESNAREIQQWVKGETELVILENTDHLLSDRQTSAQVAQKIIAWLQNIM